MSQVSDWTAEEIRIAKPLLETMRRLVELTDPARPNPDASVTVAIPYDLTLDIIGWAHWADAVVSETQEAMR